MSDKNFEEKLKQHWREEADSIPVPDSLHPAKIEEMIDKKMEVPKKRTHKKLYAGITAAAACLALLIAGTAYYFNTGRQSEKGTPVANSKPTTSDRHEFVGNTSYSEIYSLIQKYHDKQSMSDIAAEDSASTGAKSSTGAEDTTATPDYSKTDLQVKDVMEGDIVKTDGSYIRITRKMLADAGVEVKYGGKNYRIDPKAVYQKKHYQIEPDVSAACYFYAAAAITGGRALVKHVHKDNSQGDMKFLDVLAQMGCTVTEKADGIEVTGPAEDTLKGIEIDMNDFSDQALTLAAMAPFCKSDVHITHIGHIRGQECDRLHAMSEELTKRGITCTEEPDAITIKPGIPSAGIVSTYEDHRVAMSFALLGLKVDGIVIDNPSCCRKTFENYFDLLDQLSGKDR